MNEEDRPTRTYETKMGLVTVYLDEPDSKGSEKSTVKLDTGLQSD